MMVGGRRSVAGVAGVLLARSLLRLPAVRRAAACLPTTPFLRTQCVLGALGRAFPVLPTTPRRRHSQPLLHRKQPSER